MYFTANHICTVINFLQLPEPTKICCTMYLSPYHPPVPNSAKFCKYAENLPKRANATAQLKILQKLWSLLVVHSCLLTKLKAD